MVARKLFIVSILLMLFISTKSYGESKTPGFITAAASVSFVPCGFASFVTGVENMFNTPYYEHLNRRIVGSTERLYEPGRVFYFTVIFKI